MEKKEKEIVVIIGAGRSGRGYLARQVDAETQQIVFIDEDADLIRRLNQEGMYEIRFFGETRLPVRVQGYEAYTLHDSEGERRICQASYIFICVGEQNLECAAKYLMNVLNPNGLAGNVSARNEPVKNAAEKSAMCEFPRQRVIIAAENGTKNLDILKSCIAGREILLSECLMLCTTEVNSNQKDILSEDMDYLPYNTACCPVQLPFACFEPCQDYEVLARRKVYTYNGLSACIAYLGACKGYDDYGQAANDPEIHTATERLESSINQAVCMKYGISREEQDRFSAAAKRKFRNTGIGDTISRNTRNARRKLGAGDRIAGPAKLMVQYGIDTEAIELTAAAAFWYGITCEGMDASWLLEDERFEQLFGLEDEREKSAFKPFIDAVRSKFRMLSAYTRSPA